MVTLGDLSENLRTHMEWWKRVKRMQRSTFKVSMECSHYGKLGNSQRFMKGRPTKCLLCFVCLCFVSTPDLHLFFPFTLCILFKFFKFKFLSWLCCSRNARVLLLLILCVLHRLFTFFNSSPAFLSSGNAPTPTILLPHQPGFFLPVLHPSSRRLEAQLAASYFLCCCCRCFRRVVQSDASCEWLSGILKESLSLLWRIPSSR